MKQTNYFVFATVMAMAAILITNGIQAKPSPGLIGDIWDGIGNIGGSIIGTINNVTHDGAGIVGGFIGGVYNATADIIRDAEEYAAAIGQNVHDLFTRTLVSFAAVVRASAENLAVEVSKVRNSIKRQALLTVLTTLEQINATASNLEIAVGNISIQANVTLQDHRSKIEADWNLWAEQQNDRVSESTNGNEADRERAEELTQELVDRSSKYLDHCIDEVQVHIHDYQLSVQGKISSVQGDLENLLEGIEDCLISGDNIAGGTRCSIRLNLRLAPLLTLPRQLANLKQQGLELAARGLDGSACALQTLTQFELEKRNVERELDAIIEESASASASDDDDNADEATTLAAAST